MKKLYDLGKGVYNFFKSSNKKGTTKIKKKTTPPKTINKVKGANLRKAPTKADDMARAKQYKTKNKTQDIKKNVKGVNKTSNKLKNIAKVTTVLGTGAYLADKFSKSGGDKNKKTSNTKNNDPSTKKNFGMGMVDSLSKSKVKQGPPKPPIKTVKKVKKKKSNISNSSSYDADFTRKNLEKRGLKAKNFMSAKNYTKTVKPKGVMTGPEMMKKKKDDGKAPMYEFKGTKGKVKKPQYKMGGGLMKTSKYYSGGGTVFTGR